MNKIEQSDPYICPICHKKIKISLYGSVSNCEIIGSLWSHYKLVNCPEGYVVQITILPPYIIYSILGDTKSKIYQYNEDYDKDHGSFIMQIPIITYQQLEDHEKLIKRLKNLVIFS